MLSHDCHQALKVEVVHSKAEVGDEGDKEVDHILAEHPKERKSRNQKLKV